MLVILTVDEEVELLSDGHGLVPGHAVVGEAGEHPRVWGGHVGQGEQRAGLRRLHSGSRGWNT